MQLTTFQIISSLLIFTFPLYLFISLIFLQKYICKNLNIKLGLILPIFHLIPLILIIVLSAIILFGVSFSVSKNNFSSNIDNYILTLDTNLLAGIVFQLINTVLLSLTFIIPTLVHYLIYRYYKKKRSQ